MPKALPLGNRVLALRDTPDTMSGKMHLPDEAQREKHTAVVVAIGPEVEEYNSKCPESREIREGTRILISAYGGMQVGFVDGADVLLDLNEVIAIVPDDETQE